MPQCIAVPRRIERPRLPGGRLAARSRFAGQLPPQPRAKRERAGFDGCREQRPAEGLRRVRGRGATHNASRARGTYRHAGHQRDGTWPDEQSRETAGCSTLSRRSDRYGCLIASCSSPKYRAASYALWARHRSSRLSTVVAPPSANGRTWWNSRKACSAQRPSVPTNVQRPWSRAHTARLTAAGTWRVRETSVLLPRGRVVAASFVFSSCSSGTVKARSMIAA